MRPLLYRLLVSWPASWFLGSTLLAFPWAIAAALGLYPHGFFVPYAIAAVGFLDTFVSRRETVHVVVGEPGQRELARTPRSSGASTTNRIF